MKIFTSSQVKQIDAYTIKHEPVKSIDLMERASEVFVQWFVNHFIDIQPVKVFAGPGNNGGDALAISRILLKRGWRVHAYLVNISGKLSSDCETNYKRLEEFSQGSITLLEPGSVLPSIKKDEIIIDGLFGSGLTRPVEGFMAEIIQLINRSGSVITAIDIPSGLFGEDNSGNLPENIVQAHYTLAFQFPFISFFFPENHRYTGNVTVLDIGLHPDAIQKTSSSFFTIDAEAVKTVIKRRDKYSHKGTVGHALLISGSYGMMGAAVLSARACLRGGAGLVTAHVPRYGYDILQVSVPEALVSIDESDIIFTGFPDLSRFSAIGAGPGISCRDTTAKALKRLLEEVKVPLVLDADAINILSDNQEWLSILPEDTLLTPHPGEFDRLAGSSASSYERYQKQFKLAVKYKINIILKGAHSILVTRHGDTWFNTTGNPGMATGGSGDVLTGLLVSLEAQGYEPVDAAKTGIYLHGLAGDIAAGITGEESLTASDIADYLGKAFLQIKKV